MTEIIQPSAIQPQNTRLSEFKTKIGNIARPNRFTVEINNPWSGVDNYPLISPQNPVFQYMAYKASIPQFDIEGPTFKYRGTQMALTGDYKREPLVITFINDDQWRARSFFEDWVRSYVNYDTSNERRRIDSYRLDTSIHVTQWGNDAGNQVVARYHYEDCSPMKIESIELDHGQTNSIEEFKVEFHYSKWNRVATDFHTNGINPSQTGGLTSNDTLPTDKNLSPVPIGGSPVDIEDIIGVPIDINTGNINWSNSQFDSLSQGKKEEIATKFGFPPPR